MGAVRGSATGLDGVSAYAGDALGVKIVFGENGWKQEKAWKTFIAQGKEMRPKGHPDRLAFAGLSAPQRMEKMLGKMHEREERMGKMLTALKTFYATLTPQQQKIFDDALPKPGEHRMHRS